MKKMMYRIRIDDEIDLDKIVNSGQCFRPALINSDEKLYRFIFREYILYIKEISSNDYEISCSEEIWQKIWVPYFDLDRSYKTIRESLKADTYMSEAAKMGAGIRILRQDKWEMLISFIISQRKSIPAIRTSIEKLCERYGRRVDTEYGVVNLFPQREEILDYELLDECSLGYRSPYIIDAIEKNLPLEEMEKLSDEELMESLKSIKGVGEKVANCVSLFAYNRVGRVPVDTWILKIINEVYNGENPFLKYGEVGGIVQQYAFYRVQKNKSVI